jgi:hypothetical protein
LIKIPRNDLFLIIARHDQNTKTIRLDSPCRQEIYSTLASLWRGGLYEVPSPDAGVRNSSPILPKDAMARHHQRNHRFYAHLVPPHHTIFAEKSPIATAGIAVVLYLEKRSPLINSPQ